MATIAENLQTIQNIKQNIKTAIENKGVDMTNTPFTEYSTKIDEISSGGGASSGLDFSSIGYDNSLSQSINDKYIADIAYSKQLLDEWDETKTSANSLYKTNTKLVYAPNIQTKNVQDMGYMFYACNLLTTIPPLRTENVTNMAKLFYGCSSLTIIPKLQTENVTNMAYLFYGCSSLPNIPQLQTKNVTNMEYLFYGCSSLTTIPPLRTENVTRMNNMFNACRSLTTIPQLQTKNVQYMEYMFGNCSSLTTIPQLSTENVINMSNMFDGCTSLQSLPLFDCGKVEKMGNFLGYVYINTLTDLGGFKDLKISVTSYFISRCPNLTIESLMNVINNLYDLTANGLSGQSLKFGQTNLDKLSEEQIAVATAKGWTLTA